jgi:hypothetical protein
MVNSHLELDPNYISLADDLKSFLHGTLTERDSTIRLSSLLLAKIACFVKKKECFL